MPCFSKICESHTHLPGQHRWWWGLVFINLISLKKPGLDLTHSESATVHINDCSFSQLAIWSHVAKVISNSYIPPWGWSVHTLVSGYARHQCARPHPRIIFELEVSSIYFNAVMIVLCNFERKYNLCDCLQQSHYSSIFAPHTHAHTCCTGGRRTHICRGDGWSDAQTHRRNEKTAAGIRVTITCSL